ncbi:unnamed protein product [Brassica oleracea]
MPSFIFFSSSPATTQNNNTHETDEKLGDVIGQIVNFGSLENKMIKGKDNIRLLIELRDQNNVKMMCTLWSRYAKQVYDYSIVTCPQ